AELKARQRALEQRRAVLSARLDALKNQAAGAADAADRYRDLEAREARRRPLMPHMPMYQFELTGAEARRAAALEQAQAVGQERAELDASEAELLAEMLQAD